MLLRFFVLGLDEFGSERGHLIFVQVGLAANGYFRLDDFGRGGKSCGAFFPFFSALARSLFRGGCGVGAFFGEQPARQAAREASRCASAGCAGSSGGRGRRKNRRRGVQRAIGQQIFEVGDFGLLVMRDALDGWGRSGWFAAILGQRFAGEQDRLFGWIVGRRRRAEARAFATRFATTAWFEPARATAETAATGLIAARLIVATFGFEISRFVAA